MEATQRWFGAHAHGTQTALVASWAVLYVAIAVGVTAVGSPSLTPVAGALCALVWFLLADAWWLTRLAPETRARLNLRERIELPRRWYVVGAIAAVWLCVLFSLSRVAVPGLSVVVGTVQVVVVLTLIRVGTPTTDERADRATHVDEPAAPGRGDDGHTLVEMLVALLIISAVMIAAGGTIVAAIGSQRDAQNTDRASQVASDIVEESKTRGWANLGFFANDSAPASFTPDAGTCRRTSSTAATGCSSEETVILGQTRPDGSQAPLPVVNDRVVAGTTFKVTTNVSWAQTAGLSECARAQGRLGNAYQSKRVHIVVEWSRGSKTKSVASDWVRAPRAGEQIPPCVKETDGSVSALTSDCQVGTFDGTCYVTQGLVLGEAANGKYKTIDPVQFAVSSPNRLRSVVASIPGSDPVTLAASNANQTRWFAVLGAGQQLPIGNSSISFTVVDDNGTSSLLTQAVLWSSTRIGAPLVQAIGGGPLINGLVDASSTGSGKPRADQASLTPARLCVNKDSGALWAARALVYQVATDLPAAVVNPSVTYTGVANEDSNKTSTVANPNTRDFTATLIGEPTIGSLAAPPSGVVRRYVVFPQGQKFHWSSTTVTVTATSPGSGQTVNETVTIPVYFTAAAADCAQSGSTQPTFVSP